MIYACVCDVTSVMHGLFHIKHGTRLSSLSNKVFGKISYFFDTFATQLFQFCMRRKLPRFAIFSYMKFMDLLYENRIGKVENLCIWICLQSCTKTELETQANNLCRSNFVQKQNWNFCRKPYINPNNKLLCMHDCSIGLNYCVLWQHTIFWRSLALANNVNAIIDITHNNKQITLNNTTNNNYQYHKTLDSGVAFFTTRKLLFKYVACFLQLWWNLSPCNNHT